VSAHRKRLNRHDARRLRLHVCSVCGEQHYRKGPGALVRLSAASAYIEQGDAPAEWRLYPARRPSVT
jgi:hypothetical protein